jgi:anti-anti-sigma regulatory factor
MDAAGIRALVYARRAMPEQCPLVLYRPQSMVHSVLEIAGMNDHCLIEA